MNRSYSARDSGFTLIEVMAGMIIMTIGVMGLSAAFAQTMTIETTNDEMNLAINAARGRLELIKKTGYTSIVAAYASGGSFDVSGLTPISGYPGTISIASTATYVDVTVAVTWASPSGDMSVSTNARVLK